MRGFFFVWLGLIVISGVVFGGGNVTDRFRPGEVWLDVDGGVIHAHGGGVIYHEGMYYWFGQYLNDRKYHAKAGDSIEKRSELGGVSCYLSKDLKDWKFEGVALKREAEKKGHDLSIEMIVERPKVIYNAKTKKFVMWMHIDSPDYKAAKTGVAVSDRIAGPYKYLRGERPCAGVWPINVTEADKKEGAILARDFAGGQMSRDMTLYVDDDGTAYHLAASEENQTLHVRKLNDEYTGFTGEYVRLFAGRYMEAPAIFKDKGKYYFIASGCTGWSPNAGRSAVGESVMGPWKELGNPWVGDKADKSYNTQSTYVLPIEGKDGEYIFMSDVWRPKDFRDCRYVWLPIEIKDGRPILRWRDEWDIETDLPKLAAGKELKLVWSDEFGGEKIDDTKWEVLGDSKRRDHWWLKEDSYLDGEGNLVLRTKKAGKRYSSGAVRTMGKFEHKSGYFQCRCILPVEEGHWAAFWLMCNGVTSIGNEGRDGTEIDIMEWPWRDGRVQHTLHWDGYGKAHKSKGKVSKTAGLSEGYHTFGLLWTEDEYVFYVDGRETWRTSAGGVSQVPEYIKLSEEIGDWGGDIKKAHLPDYFIVDHVRVYDIVETGKK